MKFRTLQHELTSTIMKSSELDYDSSVQLMRFILPAVAKEIRQYEEDVERRHIESVLRETGGDINRSANALNIDRATLYQKIEKYGLKRSLNSHVSELH